MKAELPGSPSDYPKSYINLGGRGTDTQPDGISASGAVTTPSSKYFYDRAEGFNDSLNGDKDYGIWTSSSQDINDYRIFTPPEIIPQYVTDLLDTTSYYTLTLNQTRTFGQSSIVKIGERLNNGDPVDVWLYGYTAIADPPPDYIRKYDKGYLINCVLKVAAKAGTEVKIGLIPGVANNNDLNNIDIKSGFMPSDGAITFLNTYTEFAPFFPVNEIKFTVQ